MTSTETNTAQFTQQSSWEDSPETNNAKLESSPMLNTPSTANGDAQTCISPGMDSTNGRDSLGNISNGQQYVSQIMNPPTSPGVSGPNVVIEEEAQQEFEEIAGRVRELCRCQSGSRYLQRQLTKGHPQVASLILKEVFVEDEITGLMMDQYGNYLCQQLFQASAVYERRTMLTKLAPDAFKIACDRRGTHALQALIGLLSTAEEEMILLHVLQSKLLDLATDVNGTHVVQRILICFSTDATDMVFGPVIRNLPKIAQNPYGLCVVKKCISQASRSAHFDGMMKTISHHALDLMQSPYGNYAVQHALECWGGQACRDIVRQVLGRTLQLSIQKFSSNVVEKCIEYADEEYRHKIIEELMECEKMSVLISSNYGNYVVMKALEMAQHHQSVALQRSIWRNLRNVPNKKTRQKWEKMVSASNQRPPTASRQSSAATAPAVAAAASSTMNNNQMAQQQMSTGMQNFTATPDWSQMPFAGNPWYQNQAYLQNQKMFQPVPQVPNYQGNDFSADGTMPYVSEEVSNQQHAHQHQNYQQNQNYQNQ